MKVLSSRKLLALLLSLALCVGLIPAAAAAPADDITTRPLRVLCLGSSFALNTTENLYAIAKAEGLDLTVGMLYYSGCTLKMHNDFAANNSPVYQYYKWDGSPKAVQTNNYTILNCIKDEPWDVFVLQHGSGLASQAYTYQPDLDTLISYIDANKTNPNSQYLWHMYWAYQVGFPNAAYTAESQMETFYGILDAAQQVIVPMENVVDVIPTGPAIQNARTSYFGDKLTRDGQHLNDLGKLIASYAWYCTIAGETNLTELKYPYAGSTLLSEGDQAVVLESVNNAMQHPFALTPSVYSLDATAHWSWTASADPAANAAALASSTGGSVNASSVYTADGPSAFSSFSVASGDGAQFELSDMSALAVADCGVANLSMGVLYPNTTPAENQNFLHDLQVKVSLDGETFLPDAAGVRAVTLAGGGALDESSEGLLFRVETDDLLSIPGVTSTSSIRRVRLCLPGDPFGFFTLSDLTLNTYTSTQGFALAVPANGDAVQAVVAPLTEGGDFLGGVHIAASSDEAMTACAVTLYNDTFDSEIATYPVAASGVTGVNFESAELNAALGALADGEYRIDVAVTTASGTTTRSFPFTKGRITPCMGNHTGRIALTQEYLDTLSTTTDSGKTGRAYSLPSGSYYLAEDLDVTKSFVITNGKNVTLCLNGHTLRNTLAANADQKYYYSSFFFVYGTLNICDHTGGGKIKMNSELETSSRSYAGYVFSVQYGLLNIYDGSICDSHCYSFALRATHDIGGVINMYGGTIENNVPILSSSAITGAAVGLQKNGVFNMYGGEIRNNGATGTTGTLGCGVVTASATDGSSPTFNMYGGKITGNKGLRGSAVLIQEGGTFNMTGGEISGNTADRFGAVYVSGTEAAPATFHMGGGVISDNVCTSTSATYGRGGGVTLSDYSMYDFYGGTVSGNKAIAGGGIYVNNANSMLEMTYDAVVEHNEATTNAGIGGGGVAAINGTILLSGGIIRDNTAVNRGGGASVYDGTVSVSNTTIKDNTVTAETGKGGAIFVGTTAASPTVRPSVKMTAGNLAGTKISGNSAAAGSVLYLAHADGIVTGGAIAADGWDSSALHAAYGASLTVEGGDFTGGGGVTVENDGASFTMTGGTFGAKGDSGAILFTGDSGSVTGRFIGGTTYLPVETRGDAAFAVALSDGNFASVSDSHSGVTAYGGRFADDTNLAAVAADGATITDSGDAYFKYKLTSGIPGDLNGDGQINAKDVVLILRHIAGGYGVTLPVIKADFDHNGAVTVADAVLLMRYLAGGYGVALD